MRSCSTLLIMGLCMLNVHGQSYSVQILNTGMLETSNAVHFVDASIGYAAVQGFGQSGVLKTTDGGLTWSFPLIIGNPLRDVYFLNADTGYVVGDDGIYKTMDAGGTWEIVRTGYFRSVYFTSPDTGFAAGNGTGGLGVWKTTDAGATWNMVLYEEASFLHFQQPNHGFVSQVRWPYTDFYRTTDGGDSWTPMTFAGLDNAAACFFFTSADTGYVGEWEQGIFKTTDGCSTWTALDLGGPFYFHGMHFLDADHGIAVGNDGPSGVVLQTMDGGASWSILFSDQLNCVFTDVHFPEPGVGYVCGTGGTMLKLTALDTGVEEEAAVAVPVLYPNPASGAFSVRSPCGGGTVTITNALGELVAQQRLTGSATPMTLERNGTYQVEVHCGEQGWRNRLVVCR